MTSQRLSTEKTIDYLCWVPYLGHSSSEPVELLMIELRKSHIKAPQMACQTVEVGADGSGAHHRFEKGIGQFLSNGPFDIPGVTWAAGKVSSPLEAFLVPGVVRRHRQELQHQHLVVPQMRHTF
jgi:hypothetical protein